MDSFKKLKLFPDKWYKRCTEREISQSRGRLTSYSISKELDQGILEVGAFSFIKWWGGDSFPFPSSPDAISGSFGTCDSLLARSNHVVGRPKIARGRPREYDTPSE
jgi:hypothetical protein